MNEQQFEAAMLVRQNAAASGGGLEAAKMVLVDGMSQAAAARQVGISRQAVFNAIRSVYENYEKAKRVKGLFFRNSKGSGVEKFKVADYIISKKFGQTSLSYLAYLDCVKPDFGLSIKQAAEKYGVSEAAVHWAFSDVDEKYRLAEKIAKLA